MRLLLVLALGLMFVASGCGTKKHRSSAEGADEMAQADTATVDSDGNAEALPPVDDGHPASNSDSAPVAEAAPPVNGTGELATYTVQAGDTLMKIAFNVYGDIRQWKTIYELNKDLVKSANNLTKGSLIKYDKP